MGFLRGFSEALQAVLEHVFYHLAWPLGELVNSLLGCTWTEPQSTAAPGVSRSKQNM